MLGCLHHRLGSSLPKCPEDRIQYMYKKLLTPSLQISVLLIQKFSRGFYFHKTSHMQIQIEIKLRIYEIILNLDKWFKRKSHLKVFLI